MPATESTWRDTSLLHRIFAIGGVVLTLATVWMFYKDHSRPWKEIQPTVVNIDLKTNQWRREQFDTTEAVLTHDKLSQAATAAKAQSIPEDLLAEFKREMARDAEYRQTSVRTDWIDQWAQELTRLAGEAARLRAAAEAARLISEAKPEDEELYRAARTADAAALAAEEESASYRTRFLDRLRAVVLEAKTTREDKVLGLRKFKSANIDAAKANLDIAIRDNLGEEEIARRQKIVDELVNGRSPEDRNSYSALNLQYQTFAAHRKALDKLIVKMTATADKAQKEYEDSLATLERLKTQYQQQKETYFQLSSEYPFIFGKKILTLPILDAFGSPRKVENLWSEGLEQTYGSFGQVRRFDRCTTCHASIQKSLPGQPTTPAFVPEETLQMVVVPPPKDAPPKQRRDDQGQLEPLTLEDWLGVRLAGEGLIRADDVTVSLVLPKSPAARARIITDQDAPPAEPGLAIRQQVARIVGQSAESSAFPPLPGLIVGDVITGINGSLLQGGDRGPKRVGAYLLTLAQDGKPIRLTVRRGLPNPYTSHPRLDLFVGDSSPHPMQTFACTVCHDGQGSATEFKWASHTPDNERQAEQWRQEYGWFDNHHWIFPMYPQRFAESACLKCHHEVVELEPSDRFPDPPAPKVVHGYQLIRKYGCFGCHEINGFDGPTRRIGPDLRSEPNYFAAAQAMMPYLPPRLAHFQSIAAELTAAMKPVEQQLQDLAAQRTTLEAEKAAIPADATDKDVRTKALDDQLAALAANEKPVQELLAAQRRDLATAHALASAIERTARLVNTLAAHPEDTATRHELQTILDDDIRIALANQDKPLAQQQWTAFDATVHGMANWFKDQEAPGTQRRPGPSLRYLADKADRAFLYDWLADPTHFRPSTRMPRFFGLVDHLKNEQGEVADKVSPTREPIEIRGTIEFLLSQSAAQLPAAGQAVNVEKLVQLYEPLPREPGISPWTDEEKAARGKIQFQTRGCLACHTHKDFPDVAQYRKPDEIVQGPDLSAVGNKFSADVNPAGPDWLYSWIKEPTRYHTRTVMPNLFLLPETDPGADPNDKSDDKTFDPADDIAVYLLTDSRSDWKPIAAAASATKPLDAAGKAALQDLMLEYLNEAFYREQAEQFLVLGIPPELQDELKGAEKDLIVDPASKPTSQADWEAQREEQQLLYIGRKTIAKYGCFGCHDIPGFEDAKPIGTGLADWGRKDPARLAFEHITHYLEGHGHGAAGHDTAAHEPTAEHVEPAPHSTAAEDTEAFYHHQLAAGNRIGFINQKLKEPRSFDFEKTENKRFNERLRMPQFPFTAKDREAVITFVLGLVADPPREKYIFTPDERSAALIAGRQALEKYNCGGCHILDLERWKISYPPGSYGPQTPPDKPLPVFPFLLPQVSPKDLAAQATPDHRNLLHSHLFGLPKLSKADGLPEVGDVDGVGLIDEELYSPGEIRLSIDLFQPTLIDGHSYITGQSAVATPIDRLADRRPTWGGVLTNYLLPTVTALEKQANPNASGSEAYGWLPPPLTGEGHKVQSNWLHDFLLEPYPIRPAVFLRMPKFNMSSAEATDLANYFAAVDNADYPYNLAPQRLDSELAARARTYAEALQAANVPPPDGVPWTQQTSSVLIQRRFDDALQIVVDGNYCVKCHNVADYQAPGRDRAKAPNLADVYRRFKPDYLRRWIAQPNMILPYTSMPVNVKFEPDKPFQGGVSQDLYHGTSTQQVDALVDLLMNYDQFSRSSRKVAELVKPVTVPAEGAPPAAAGNSGE